ncbi:MAG TPA: ATP phosphoribosyltransferase, partial [Candidatus Acidoferrales bacterium]|nr:ATP phosphoribosyltransferase [Candidatus Acidoferrales bacterium]
MAADKVLKFGIPKGSLEQQTLELMRKSGWRISVDSRSYIPNVDDPALSCRILRPQEMPRYIADGSLDAGITGSDWIVENDVKLEQVESFIYAKATLKPSRWVLCVRENSPVKRLEDLQGKRIATEIVSYVKRILAQRKIKA